MFRKTRAVKTISISHRLLLVAVLCVASSAVLFAAVSLGRVAGGGMIAFESNRDIDYELYLLDIRSGFMSKIIRQNSGAYPPNEFRPVWSPDGRQIAFIGTIPTEMDGITSAFNQDIFVVDALGGVPANITRDPADIESVADWSPDGQQILFLSNRNWALGAYETRGLTDLFVMNPDGGGVRQLVNLELVYYSAPAWSPDGQRIVFAGAGAMRPSTASANHDVEIYAVNGDGSDFRALTQDTRPDCCPAWSPDGRRIAFMSLVDETEIVYLLNADGSDLRLLARHPASGTAALDRSSMLAWSPDGSAIAAVMDEGGTLDIFHIDTASGAIRNLTNHAAYDFWPIWSPDSRRLLFVSHRYGNGEVFLVDADGSNLRDLSNHDAEDYSPVWWGG